MAEKSILQLDQANLPLGDNDAIAVVQSGVTRRAPISSVRDVSFQSIYVEDLTSGGSDQVPTLNDSTTLAEIVTFINAKTFAIDVTRLTILRVLVQTMVNSVPYLSYAHYKFTDNNEAGTWGTGVATDNGEVFINQLVFDSVQRVTPDNAATTIIIELGDIASSTVENHLNNNPQPTSGQDWELLNGNTYFFSYTQDGVAIVDFYRGTKPVILGSQPSGNYTALDTDFQRVSTDGVGNDVLDHILISLDQLGGRVSANENNIVNLQNDKLDKDGDGSQVTSVNAISVNGFSDDDFIKKVASDQSISGLLGVGMNFTPTELLHLNSGTGSTDFAMQANDKGWRFRNDQGNNSLQIAAVSGASFNVFDTRFIMLKTGEVQFAKSVEAVNFIGSGEGLTPTTTINTNTTIVLNNVLGNYCNMASVNTNATFTTSNEVTGGKASVLINRATAPTVTGATLIKGSEFIASTDMYLKLENNGNRTEYWFEQILA